MMINTFETGAGRQDLDFELATVPDSGRPVRRLVRKATRVLLGLVVLALVLLGVRFLIMNGLVDEEAEIDPALMAQGTVYPCSVGGQARLDGTMNASVGVYRAGRDGHFRPGAELRFVSSVYPGAGGWVPLGGSLSAPDLGTIYLIALTTFEGVQDVQILYIPPKQ